jgi:hypothetical protein
MGEMRNANKILVGKSEGRKTHCRSRRREKKAVDLINLAQNKRRWWAVVNTVMNLRIL